MSNLLPSNVFLFSSPVANKAYIRKFETVKLTSSLSKGTHYESSKLSLSIKLPSKTKHNCQSHYTSTNTTSVFSFTTPFTKLSSNLFPRPILDGGSCHALNLVAGDSNEYTLADPGRDNVPKHVAIILDGSRRWLKAHGKPLSYEPFFEANMRFANLCMKWGVGTATTFVYSLKNLEKRGKEANDILFGDLEICLEQNTQHFIRKGINLKVIGERSALPESLRNKIAQVEEATRKCTRLEFMLAVCYSGTRDIVQATRSICDKVNSGVIQSKAIEEGLLESELSTNGSRAPKIDLLIRTGGRLRISDFLMWQLAQAELYFTNISPPEFGELEFIEALRSFQQRERTFGK